MLILSAPHIIDMFDGIFFLIHSNICLALLNIHYSMIYLIHLVKIEYLRLKFLSLITIWATIESIIEQIHFYIIKVHICEILNSIIKFEFATLIFFMSGVVSNYSRTSSTSQLLLYVLYCWWIFRMTSSRANLSIFRNSLYIYQYVYQFIMA